MNTIQFKIILRSLQRNRFYSILSISGVTLTFIFLTIVFIYLRQETGNIAPDVYRDQTVKISDIRLSNGAKFWIDSDSYKYYMQLKEPEFIAHVNTQCPQVFHNNKTIQGNIAYTNADFFNIFCFEYLHGRGFTVEEENSPVIVMTERYAQEYFNKTDVLGEKYKLLGTTFTVVGVVKDPFMHSETEVYAAYLPQAFNQYVPQRETSHDIYMKAKDKNSIPAMSNEINRFNRQLFEQRVFHVEPVAKEWLPVSEEIRTSHYVSISIVILLLLLIPAFNILSLNSGYIKSQAEEIAVKRTYGATKNKIIREILTGNILLTVTGALLGTLLAIPFLKSILFLINLYSPDPIYFVMRPDIWVVLTGLISALIFSMLSGFIPAWITSKKEIINGLKGGKS